MEQRNERSDERTDFAELLVEIARGDEFALATFYDATVRRVFGLILRILGDSGAAEETALDVYLDVWKKSSSYDPDRGRAIAWLLTIARNRAIDRLRSVGFRR